MSSLKQWSVSCHCLNDDVLLCVTGLLGQFQSPNKQSSMGKDQSIYGNRSGERVRNNEMGQFLFMEAANCKVLDKRCQRSDTSDKIQWPSKCKMSMLMVQWWWQIDNSLSWREKDNRLMVSREIDHVTIQSYNIL